MISHVGTIMGKQLKLETSFEEGLEISGYDIKLFQLWSNLIKNAIDAMEGQQNRSIRIQSYQTNDAVIVSISNNGPEIPEKIINQIFKVLKRIYEQRKHKRIEYSQ